MASCSAKSGVRAPASACIASATSARAELRARGAGARRCRGAPRRSSSRRSSRAAGTATAGATRAPAPRADRRPASATNGSAKRTKQRLRAIVAALLPAARRPDAREHRRRRRRAAQLALDDRQRGDVDTRAHQLGGALERRVLDVDLGQRAARARRRAPGTLRLGRLMIVAVHPQEHRRAARAAARSPRSRAQPRERRVVVAAERGARCRSRPAGTGTSTSAPLGARQRHSLPGAASPTPRHTTAVVEIEAAQDARHLRDVPERVGQIADRHRAAEATRAAQPLGEVAHDRFGADEELVLQHVPRADADAARRRCAPAGARAATVAARGRRRGTRSARRA